MLCIIIILFFLCYSTGSSDEGYVNLIIGSRDYKLDYLLMSLRWTRICGLFINHYELLWMVGNILVILK